MHRIKLSIAFLMCIYIAGCYTVIQHPTLSESVIEETEFYDENVLYIDDCSRCHDSAQPFRSSYVETYHTMPAYHNFYRWQYFYDMPWWQGINYYSSSPAMDDDEILPPTQKRNFDRRDDSVGNSTLSSPASNSGPATLSKQAGSQTSGSGAQDSDKRDFSRRESSNYSDPKPKEKPQPDTSKTKTEKQE